MVVVSVFLTTIIANMGGYVDEVIRADTTFDYDKANRLEARTEPWGRSTSHSVPAEHCVEIVEPDSPFRTTAYEHDPVGNLLSETITAPRMSPKTFKYGYDVLNRRTSEKRLDDQGMDCLLYTSPSPRDRTRSRMPSSA